MKKLLIICLLFIVSSCGAWEVTTSNPVYTAGNCSVANYQYGIYGWAWYDCYGNPVYQRHNYGPTYIPGPRIIIRSSGNTNNSRSRVNVKGRRGEKK